MTEKRAYAVVRASSGGTRWLSYISGDTSASLAPFADGDEVEIRLRESSGSVRDWCSCGARLGFDCDKCNEALVAAKLECASEKPADARLRVAQGERGLRESLIGAWRQSEKPIDHACAQCVPGGSMLVAGFRCWWHPGEALAAHSPPEDTIEPARVEMLVVCAANWDTPHVLNSHHLSESHYCINPKDAPRARSATPEPEKLGEDEGNCVICGKPRGECRRESLAAGRTISIDAYAPTTKVGEN